MTTNTRVATRSNVPTFEITANMSALTIVEHAAGEYVQASARRVHASLELLEAGFRLTIMKDEKAAATMREQVDAHIDKVAGNDKSYKSKMKKLVDAGANYDKSTKSWLDTMLNKKKGKDLRRGTKSTMERGELFVDLVATQMKKAVADKKPFDRGAFEKSITDEKAKAEARNNRSDDERFRDAAKNFRHAIDTFRRALANDKYATASASYRTVDFIGALNGLMARAHAASGTVAEEIAIAIVADNVVNMPAAPAVPQAPAAPVQPQATTNFGSEQAPSTQLTTDQLAEVKNLLASFQTA